MKHVTEKTLSRADRARAHAIAKQQHKIDVMNYRITLFKRALQDYLNLLDRGERLQVSISFKNDKMGPVPSISTLPFITCPAICRETCGPDCYAAKIAATYSPQSLQAWARNTAILMRDPETFWAAVDLAVKSCRFFRFHVAGDIFGAAYFAKMVETARNNPHCKMLAFTKAFSIVNSWIRKNGPLPENLIILFSGWYEMRPDNPYNLPETNVLDRGADIPENWIICGGNCFECACRGTGCWTAKNGETIAFYKH